MSLGRQALTNAMTHDNSAGSCVWELKDKMHEVSEANTLVGHCGSEGEQIRGKAPLNVKNKKVLVVGLARTGLSVARFLSNQGARVTVTDLKEENELEGYFDEALALGASLKLGTHDIQHFTGADLIVLSPGVPLNITPLEAARAAGIPLMGEVELASRYIDKPIVAITGTNGKTTTTRLVGDMLEASGRRVFVGGNIGAPLIDYVNSGEHADVIVAEISSFQLDTIERFRPAVGVLLNVTEDHLDRYSDFHDYARSKGRLFMNQNSTDLAILNAKDWAVTELESSIHSTKLYFNIDSPGHGPVGFRAKGHPLQTRHGAVIQNEEITCHLPGKTPVILSLARFGLKGGHNLENAAAASLTALASGGNQAGIQAALNSFKGLRHRLEWVRNVNGVQYYNDSKATNVDAVKRSLESFQSPIILIMGGRDKGGGYTVLEHLIRKRVKRLIAMGEAREKILNALGEVTRSNGVRTLQEAVHLAYEGAAPGDIVLLAPGCSSFDMFADYVERGAAFCKVVEELKQQ